MDPAAVLLWLTAVFDDLDQVDAEIEIEQEGGKTSLHLVIKDLPPEAVDAAFLHLRRITA